MSLVLSRRIGETLCIGDEVTVTVESIKGNQVKLSISAPRDVSIDRQEIRIRKEQNNHQPQ